MDSFIKRHLRGVSRTYAILIPMLPRPLADTVGLSYLLMRVVDTLEDCTALSDGQRLERLALLEGVLRDDNAPLPPVLREPLGDTPDEAALQREVDGVISRLRALEPEYRAAASRCAAEMIRGVRQFMTRAGQRGVPYPAVQTAEELREYCYFVAGVVGEMLCTMMAQYLKQPALLHLHDLAIELGIGLQLVNILKDACVDGERGRRYLPTMPHAGVAHAEIFKAALQEARESLRRGMEFVLALPAAARELRCFCGLPIAWGALTLEGASRDASRAKIGRGAIQATILRFRALASNDQALRRWLGGLLGPSAQPA